MQIKHPITEFLKAEGKTQEWLSGLIGLSQPQISRILSGNGNPSIQAVVRMHQTTGVPVDEIIDWHMKNTRERTKAA